MVPPSSAVGAFSFSAASLESALCLAASMSSCLTFRIKTQHRATWFVATSPSGGSGSSLHLAITKGQRGWNLQPGGECERSGGSPLIDTSLSLRASSTRGTERRRDQVYGGGGRGTVGSTGPPD